MKRLIIAQTKLAKDHQIYGFAIFFKLFQEDNYVQIAIKIFLNVIGFPIFLIWRNEELENIDENIIKFLIDYLKQSMISENYIKFKEKPILSINKPNKILNITKLLLFLRKEAKKEFGEIFILYPFTGNFKLKKFLREFDAIYDFSKIDLLEDISNSHNIIYYSGNIYKNLYLNKLDINFSLFRTCYANKYFKDFKPEKFYIANNIIFNWERINLKQNGGFIIIDSWNDYQNGNYLEPDEKYGYALINTFSNSILNFPFYAKNLTFENNNIIIALQIHVYYEDLFLEIIDKINVIPFKYDLFISTISVEKKTFIEKCLFNSTANKYEIEIFDNKGRDVFPFIKQMKRKFKKYKYICHIHTKKSVHKLFLGSYWREYIYENLIGNKEIISEILYDFEKNEKLGFIFPEAYYDLIKGIKDFENTNLALHFQNKKDMNFILKRIFGEFKVDEKLVFPVGNMFWAKTKAIYQIFKVKLKYPKESNQDNKTIMHAIERIWLYLVKLNGYYYKTIFKHY